MNDRYLGLDLGRTNIKTAILEQAETGFKAVWTDQRDTRAGLGPDVVTHNLVEAAHHAIQSGGPVSSVGLGVPGLFNSDTGNVVLFPNLPGAWNGYPLRRKFEEALGQTVWMVNDARAFTLAEGTMGAGAGYRTVACMTLGTGIGGGIVIDGRLHRGAFGVAGELGHQTIDPNGPRCGVGTGVVSRRWLVPRSSLIWPAKDRPRRCTRPRPPGTRQAWPRYDGWPDTWGASAGAFGAALAGLLRP